MDETGDRVGIADHDNDDKVSSIGGFAFVGRQHEVGLVLAALRRPPAIVLVEGEAGIGKTRLVHEAAKTLVGQGARVLTGFCHPLREPSPYGPVVDAMRKAGKWLPPVEDIPRSAGALASLLPDLADRLPSPPPRASDARAERHQVLHGLRSFLGAVGPAVLVIEDLHWVDEATREMLLLLSRDMPEHLGLVLTFRGEDLPPNLPLLGSAYRRQPGTGGIEIHLEPLSAQAVQELARDALGDQASTALGNVLFDRSQGVPLVVEEDLITFSEHGPHHGWKSADLELTELPRGLREALTERLAVLPPTAVAVVEAAAVLGVPATEDLLAEVAGLDSEQGSRGLTEALRATILRETGPARYFFRHILAQQVAYRRIPGPPRNRLHRQALTALEAQPAPPLVQIAHHTLMLGDREAWRGRAEAAAEQAIAFGDVGTAATLLRRILDEAGLPDDLRSRAALALSGIAINGTDFVTNAEVLRRILADPHLPVATRGEIRLSLGIVMVGHAGDRAGFEEIARAVDELADRPDRAARAMIALAMDERNGGPEQAWAWLERAEIAVRHGPDEAVRAAARATRLTLLAREGDPGVWARLDRLPRRSDDPEVLRQIARALYNTGEIAIELGHDRRAARLLAESGGLAHQGSPYLESYSRTALLRLETLAGDWSNVEERFTMLRREYPDITMTATDEALVLAVLAAARGQHRRALELFTVASAYGETESQVTVALRAAAGLTTVHLAQGAVQNAWSIAGNAVATLRAVAAWARGTGLVPVAVEAALSCHDREAAERLAADAERGLGNRDAPAATAELHMARGILLGTADPAAAAESYSRARQLWVDIGRPYETARADERLGGALAAAGDTRAAARLTEALAGYERLGATHDFARCQRTSRELGLTEPVPRGRPSYGGELSPRERQVAELVAQGATNQDIAHALFLSPRTVEQHVAHVLKKLGATRGHVGEALRSGRDLDTG
ncbi:DNA-binding CsgD family transcriptional regulator [Catenulispora sp. MAP5-51]|uniref:AAA family ATPase n=1 Tax=Catenulispora sp. MAP5-51 TaxID=3156298 RepID=UPI0035164E97